VDKAIIGTLLLAILAIVSITSLSYYMVSQPDQTPTTLSPTPTPTSTPMITPAPTPEPKLTHNYVAYEWYLKAEYINNITWLKSSIASLSSKYYNYSKTWSENYITYLESYWAFPEELVNSDMGVLAKAAFVRWVSASVSFNETTGFTKVLYPYESNEVYYVIESSLPHLADDRGWTKALV
jgi:hypothetical protein